MVMIFRVTTGIWAKDLNLVLATQKKAAFWHRGTQSKAKQNKRFSSACVLGRCISTDGAPSCTYYSYLNAILIQLAFWPIITLIAFKVIAYWHAAHRAHVISNVIAEEATRHKILEEKQLDLNISQATTRGIWFPGRTLRQNRFQLNSQLQR